VVPDNFHDFFLTSGGVAGALIGLLFVVLSVISRRLAEEKEGAQIYRIRASAALTAFTNALTVSLFALIPGEKLGGTALVVAIVGLLFVAASLLSVLRRGQMRRATARDMVFMLGLIAVFILQAIAGTRVLAHPHNPGSVDTIAILVIVCFLIGVARAWELIGGPSIGLTREVTELLRNRERESDGENG
jgi:small-conductance mechanosensitive channel